MQRVVGDTGFVVALTNRSDPRHGEVAKVYFQQNEIVLPQTVLAEVAYLIQRDAGAVVLIRFLRGLAQSKFVLMALMDGDLLRTAEILAQYQDSRIDFVDATVMAIAERENITTVLTLDRRDFSLFRPKHCLSFTLLP
jgi:predicted nucleic acid-binding protein